MFSPSNRSSERSDVGDEAFTSTTRLSSGCFRLKARNCVVSALARLAAARISRNVLRFRAFHPDVVEQQIAVAEDRGQEIIEVVRDAAGQLAERFHLLRTQHLILQLLALGDVHERADKSHGLAVGVRA